MCVHSTFCLTIHLPKEDLGCFYLLNIVNNVAMNMDIQISFESLLSIIFDKYSKVEFLDQMVILFLTFLGIPILFSIAAACTILHSTNSAQDSKISPQFSQHLLLSGFVLEVILIIMKRQKICRLI